MISKIAITIDKEISEAIELLSKTEVLVSSGYIARWKNPEISGRFNFQIENYGIVPPWNSKCRIENSNDQMEVHLIMWFYPAFWSLPFLAFVLGGYIYSVVQFGIHNYGTSGFWPSIVVPSFLLILMLIFWTVMAHFHSKRLKKKIEKALFI